MGAWWVGCRATGSPRSTLALASVFVSLAVEGGPNGAFSYAQTVAPDGSLPELAEPPGPDDEYLSFVDLRDDQIALVGAQIEIDVAVADFKCREKTTYVDRYLEILVDLEQQYVDEHKAELEEVVARGEQGDK